jgi:hypothetical protein
MNNTNNYPDRQQKNQKPKNKKKKTKKKRDKMYASH